MNKALRKTVRFAKAGFFGVKDKLYHLSEEVLRNTVGGAIGLPVYLEHDDNGKTYGYVSNVYEADDGWYNAEIIITDDNMKSVLCLEDCGGYKTSNAYNITDGKEGDLRKNGINYNMEIQGVDWLELTLTKNPRYQEATIFNNEESCLGGEFVKIENGVWEEEKHPRDSGGKFASGGKADKKESTGSKFDKMLSENQAKYDKLFAKGSTETLKDTYSKIITMQANPKTRSDELTLSAMALGNELEKRIGSEKLDKLLDEIYDKNKLLSELVPDVKKIEKEAHKKPNKEERAAMKNSQQKESEEMAKVTVDGAEYDESFVVEAIKNFEEGKESLLSRAMKFFSVKNAEEDKESGEADEAEVEAEEKPAEAEAEVVTDKEETDDDNTTEVEEQEKTDYEAEEVESDVKEQVRNADDIKAEILADMKKAPKTSFEFKEKIY